MSKFTDFQKSIDIKPNFSYYKKAVRIDNDDQLTVSELLDQYKNVKETYYKPERKMSKLMQRADNIQALTFEKLEDLIATPASKKKIKSKIQVYELRGSTLTQALESPDSVFKPGDIVRVNRNKLGSLINYYHVGVYIGNNQIAHIYNDPNKKKDNSQTQFTNFFQNRMWAQITGWPEFLGQEPKKGFKLQKCYLQDVPIRSPEAIVKVAKYLVNNQYGFDMYDLLTDNCEHFSWLCATGKKISMQTDGAYQIKKRTENTLYGFYKRTENVAYDFKQNFRRMYLESEFSERYINF